MLNKVLRTIRTDLPVVSHFTEIRYEDLIADPVETLKKIYTKIGLEYSAGFEIIVTNYLSANDEFEKNVFSITSEEKHLIASMMKEHMEFYGYQP